MKNNKLNKIIGKNNTVSKINVLFPLLKNPSSTVHLCMLEERHDKAKGRRK